MRLAPALVLSLACGGAQAGDLAYVTAQNAGRLAIIALPSGTLRADVALPGKPAAVACLPEGRGAAVIEAEGGRLTLISPDGRITAQRVIPNAFGVAVAADAIYVTDWDDARLLRLDPQSLAEVWSAPTGPAPTGLTTDGTVIAVAERDGDTLGLFTAQGTLTARVRVGAHPFGVTLHQGRAWTADVEDDSVTAVDLASGKVVGKVRTGDRPYAVAFSAGSGFVTNQYDGTLTRFDPATLAVQDTIEVGDTPEGIAVTPDGHLAVANWFSNTLSIVDPSGGPTTEIETPDGPRAFGLFVCPYGANGAAGARLPPPPAQPSAPPANQRTPV